jgi:hypothetical protein
MFNELFHITNPPVKLGCPLKQLQQPLMGSQGESGHPFLAVLQSFYYLSMLPAPLVLTDQDSFLNTLSSQHFAIPLQHQ